MTSPRPAARMAALSGEGALDVFRRAQALERAGRSVIHLELGAPDVDAPPHVVEAAVRALRDGDARYVAPQGLPELRAAVAADLAARGVAADPECVVVTPSAKTAVFYAVLASVDPGDEVLVPDPGFPIYPSAVRFAGGVPVGYAMDAAGAPDLDDVARRVTPRTRALALNAPGNPTGGALGAGGLARLAELARRHDLVVIADDIYSRLVYGAADGERAPSAAEFAPERTLLVDGFSKTYAMTGYRLGYLAAPAAWVERLVTLAVNGHTCVPPFVQRAGVAALEGPQDHVARQVAQYRARRDLLVGALNAIPGVRCAAPAGAFYAFPDFSAALDAAALGAAALTSRAFADRLLDAHGVAAIDGAAFGARGEGHLRFSFASAQADLAAAAARVAEAVAALGA